MSKTINESFELLRKIVKEEDLEEYVNYLDGDEGHFGVFLSKDHKRLGVEINVGYNRFNHTQTPFLAKRMTQKLAKRLEKKYPLEIELHLSFADGLLTIYSEGK